MNIWVDSDESIEVELCAMAPYEKEEKTTERVLTAEQWGMVLE